MITHSGRSEYIVKAKHCIKLSAVRQLFPDTVNDEHKMTSLL